MKTGLKWLVLIGFSLAPTSEVRSQGYIVPNGVITNYYAAGIAEEISVLYDPANLYYTGFALQTTPTPNTFFYNGILDVGVRPFFVSSNDPISLPAIQSGNYTELTFPNTYVFDPGNPFYVGLYTGNQNYPPPDGIYNDPLFGWALLVNNQGHIQLLDSALAYQADGILAGTRTLIPEPGGFSLFSLGLLLLGWRLRRRITP